MQSIGQNEKADLGAKVSDSLDQKLLNNKREATHHPDRLSYQIIKRKN